MDNGRKSRRFIRWLNSLPIDLEYTGEFGPELVLALPFFNWLSLTGNLQNRRIITYAGMKCFYDDLNCMEIVEKEEKRRYVKADSRASWLPVKNEHNFDNFQRSALHIWPDLRVKFQKLPLIPNIVTEKKPLLIIHNKYCDEWELGPINYLSADLLKNILDKLSPLFLIVYIRHGKTKNSGFSEDHNTFMEMNDQDLTSQYDDVHNFDDLYSQHCELGGLQSLNAFKNVLYSRCYHFISSQGGGAHQIALYSGSILSLMHRRGREETWAYENGYYRFMSTIPPVQAVCSNESDMVRSLDLFVNSTIADRRALVSSDASETLEYLSPTSFKQRRNKKYRPNLETSEI